MKNSWVRVVQGTAILPLFMIGEMACFNLDSDGNESVGLALTIPGEGPTVIWDPIATERGEIPDLPFPNDIAMRVDSSSPTGLRLNISVENAPTDFQKEINRQANLLIDGFGTIAPIWVSFDQPLDLKTVSNQSVYLLSLKDCERYSAGTRFPLDLGEGNYPTQLQTALRGECREIFANDPYRCAEDTIFNQEPDTNGDGQCDPVDEDLNGDGKCNFVGNRFNLDDDAELEYVDFYDLQTNTLLIRPKYTLDEQCEYVVVLTRGIKGLNQFPIKSPFQYVNHTTQTESLKQALPHLEKFGVEAEEIAIAWKYTTGTQTKYVRAVLEGLRGQGPMALLKEEFPAKINSLSDLQAPEELGGETGSPYILKAEPFQRLATTLFFFLSKGSLSGGRASGKLMVEYVDYFVYGTFNSPSFTESTDFPEIPSTEGVFLVDYATGIDLRNGKRAAYKNTDVVFVCSIPKARPQHGIEPPFPVIFFGHGFSASRVKATLLAGPLARLGFATCGMDFPDHGPMDNLRPENFVNYICGDLGLCSDEDFLNLLDLLFKETIAQGLDLSDEDCMEQFGETCSEAAIEDLALLLLEELSSGRSEEDPSLFCDRLIQDLQGMDEILGIDLFTGNTLTKQLEKTCAQKLAASGKTLDLNAIREKLPEAFDALKKILFTVLKELVIREIARFCPDVKHIWEIPASTEMTDLMDQLWHCPLLGEVVGGEGRARGIDLHGEIASGGKLMDTTNPFHTWANMIQAAVDQQMFIQTILQCDGKDSKGRPSPFECDFNEDGVVDLGPDFHLSGSSLGSIGANIYGPLIPEAEASLSFSGGAILTDIAVRTRQEPYWEIGFSPICTPCVAGRFQGEEYQLFLTFSDLTRMVHPDDPKQADLSHLEYFKDTSLTSQMPRGYATLKNLRNGEEKQVRIHSDGRFRVSVATDIGDPLHLILKDENQNILLERDLTSPIRGYGMERNSPRFRRFLSVGQHLLDPISPHNYLNHYFTADLPTNDPETGFVIHNRRFEEIPSNRGVVNVATVYDNFVPISTELATPRIIGTIDEATNEELIRKGIYRGAMVDGPAYVNAEGKICMEGSPDCANTYDENGTLCPLDEEGRPTPCYDLVPAIVDPILWIPNGKNSEEPPSECSPIDPASPQGANLCSPKTAHVPDLDRRIVHVENDPASVPGPVPPTKVGNSTPVETSARFALIGDTDGYHGLNGPDPKYKIPLPEPYEDIPSDVGSFLINQMGYYFLTGKLSDDPCLMDASCPWADFPPP
ncbi:MAG: hypothetical protein HY538_01130 [Deltaproteobacteria bacterium]|nr:hypothetical protein [Deltaproteobacteria bacterium]